MILSDIEAKLQTLDPNVFYGVVNKNKLETVWNCIVFGRTNIKHSANKTSASDYFEVLIIRENYIPEGFEDEVIQALTELDGVRHAGNESRFDYIQKPNTNITVELLTITFVRSRKNA